MRRASSEVNRTQTFIPAASEIVTKAELNSDVWDVDTDEEKEAKAKMDEVLEWQAKQEAPKTLLEDEAPAAPEQGHYLPPATEVDEEGDFVTPEIDAAAYDLDLMEEGEELELESEEEDVPAPKVNLGNGKSAVPWDEMRSSLKEEQDLAVSHKQFGNDELWDQAIA